MKVQKRKPNKGESVPLKDAEEPWTCPVHGAKVTLIPRKRPGDDETQGFYYGCLGYHECGYYITSDLKKVARSARIE